MRNASRLAIETFVAAFLLHYMAPARSDNETPLKTQQAKPIIVDRGSLMDPPISRYCARDGELIEDRIARLETALRLARAELKVNRGKKR